jgi:tetratricopeptide (TPR) repeat protein
MAIMKEILELLDASKFEEAEERLKSLLRKSPRDPVANFFLGRLYDDYRNPGRSRDKSRKCFQICVAADPPLEWAFPRLARLETNARHALRILRKGAELFPDNPEILYSLLRAVPLKERPQVYEMMVEKDVADDSSRILMARTYADLGRFGDALDLVRDLHPESETSFLALEVVRASYMLELGKSGDALSKLGATIERDINHELEYAAHLISIVGYLRNASSDLHEALRVFSEIPDEFEFCLPFYPCEEAVCFDYMRYLLEAMRLLLRCTRRKVIAARARGIRGLSVLASKSFDLYSRIKTRKDLEFAHSNTPGNVKYCLGLIEIESVDANVFQVYRLSIDLLGSLFGDELRGVAGEIDCYLSLIGECSDSDFDRILRDLRDRLAEDRHGIARGVTAGVLVPVIERLHERKEYSSVVELVRLLGDYYLTDTDVLFEIAYALSNAGDRAAAAKYYELHLQKHGDTSPTLNNLALIREAAGELQEAENLLRKAKVIEPDDLLIKRNLKRIAALRKAAAMFMRASLREKKALLALWDERDVDDRIVFREPDLHETLEMTEEEASVLFEHLVSEKILIPTKDADSTSGEARYEVNPEVRKSLPQVRDEVGQSTEVLEIAADIGPRGFSRIGYDEELRSCLNKIGSAELQSLLDRDLREAAFGLLTRSYKSTLILCGSLIEAVLLDRLSTAGVAKWKCSDGRVRRIERLTLGDLLGAASHEKLIDDELFYLAHALREFRNLIHPGVEHRRTAGAISERNARIAWDITRKLLYEI